ncbi:MAG TPA: serine hydrolase domain-containing protein [Anaeromyxobacteraceae bacterium]
MTLAPVLAALEAGRREGVAPGLSAVVLAKGAPAHASFHGAAQVVPEPRALGAGDLFDVASLTKVMATASLAALLAEAGALELDAPAARWLAALAGEKAPVTVRHLLAHAAGFPAWRPLHAAARGRDSVVAAAAVTPLDAAPGTRAVYSDLGFIVLGAVLEAAAGAPLDALFDTRVARPLGLASTSFVPARDPARRRSAFVATRRTPERGVACGEVDDDNAFAMGGVAGHAGLFSTAADVAALGQAWLDAAAGRSRWLRAETAARFLARDATPGSERALGWDTPSREKTTLGTRLGRGPRGAVGHLGFTGCSLWVDLDREVVCALLTNHVHPDGADKQRINAFRARFHDAVAQGLGI